MTSAKFSEFWTPSPPCHAFTQPISSVCHTLGNPLRLVRDVIYERSLAELGAVQLVAVTLELDPRCGIVRIGGGEVAEVPDVGGVVEGGGEEDVFGQQVELDQLQGKKSLESNNILAFIKKCWSANIIG